MNILIIDDMLLPEPAKADSFQKAFVSRIFEENRKRRIFFCRELQKLGANVLLIRAKLSFAGAQTSFCFKEEEGISQLFIKIPAKEKGNFLRLKELFEFSDAVFKNAPCLSGIFSPDVVICGGVFSLYASAGAKIAEGANSVLIAEESCCLKELLKGLSFLSSVNPVLTVLKKGQKAAFKKSHAVISSFPAAAQRFSGAHNLYPMVLPAPTLFEKPSEKAILAKEKLLLFREGKTFVLAFCGELESGFSIEELILSAGSFGDKFALVFLTEGRKKPYLKRFIGEKGITNVFFLDDVPKDELSFVLSGADGIFVSEFELSKGLAPEQENFFKAFGAQKPVIAASEHWADFFRKAGGVIITKPRRKDSITLGIKTLLSMTETDREILGRANKSFFDKNSIETYTKNIFSLFDNLVKQKEIKK